MFINMLFIFQFRPLQWVDTLYLGVFSGVTVPMMPNKFVLVWPWEGAKHHIWIIGGLIQ